MVVIGVEQGRAVAEAVSRRLITPESRFRFQHSQCEICGGTGRGFAPGPWFSCVNIILPLFRVHSCGGRTVDPLAAAVLQRSSLTSS
jgi:hypothetical protein